MAFSSTGVSIASISVSGGVVTVTTSSAHGLLVNQGFSLQGTTGGTYNVNQTVVTVPSSTTFTFPQGSLSATGQAGAAGSAIPAKQVIVLNVVSVGTTTTQINFVMWLTTTQPFPIASASSIYKNVTAQEATAITNGWVIERTGSKQYPNNDDPHSVIEVDLGNEYAEQQAAFAASVQPGAYYGIYSNGTGWSA
jgi:hypothetical protein